jgi:hypothetical protein
LVGKEIKNIYKKVMEYIKEWLCKSLFVFILICYNLNN